MQLLPLTPPGWSDSIRFRLTAYISRLSASRTIILYCDRFNFANIF